MTNPADAHPLTIGVLLCDHVDPELRRHSGGDYEAVFGDFLMTAADSLGVPVDVSYFDAVNGVLPAAPDECDAWVITGSRHAAHGDDPWIAALAQFLRDADECGRRMAGVCFGHQLVAVAFGGTVEPSGRWAVGPQRMTLDATPWFAECELYVHAMHQDVVTVLPPEAQLLGHGTTAEVPAYLLGDNIFCVQDHPEFRVEYVEALIGVRADRIDAPTRRAALATIEEQPTDGPQVGEAIVRFLADLRRHPTDGD